ncbi:hypothetical protein MMC16_003701 [Acarospora aff. strigata]|nr:hypothetical protein [Acarospora aff. strigata]
MSATAAPISHERFALALVDLPLSNLHLKASEFRNSISHLLSSNQQLQPFADEGDQDCVDAIRENEEVLVRLRERIELLRREVERRGFRWDDAEVEEKGDKNGDAVIVNGDGRQGQGVSRLDEAQGSRAVNGGRPGGSLTDEELARRLRDQMDQNEEDGGLHL